MRRNLWKECLNDEGRKTKDERFRHLSFVFGLGIKRFPVEELKSKLTELNTRIRTLLERL